MRGLFGDGVDFSDAFAGVFEGLGAGLGGFPSVGDPLFMVFGVGGTEDGRAEVGGWFLAGGEVGFEDGLVVETLGEVAECDHASVEEGVLWGGGFFLKLFRANDIAIVVLDVGFGGLTVDEASFGEIEAGETESIEECAGLGGRDFALGEGGEDAGEGDLDGGRVFEEGDFDAVGGRVGGRVLRAFGHAVGSAVMEVEEAIIFFPDAIAAALNAAGPEVSALFGHDFLLLVNVQEVDESKGLAGRLVS